VKATLFRARPTGESPTGGGPRRFWSGCLLAFLLGVTSGCYEYGPAPSNAVPGTRVLLELNDRGRVGLGNSIGPTGGIVEGTVQSSSDSTYSLLVKRVEYLNGQWNAWNGEPLVVPKDFVGTARERTVSASRTWLAASAVTLAALAFISSRHLLGFGSEGKGPGNGTIKTQ
jgi:hypothetical protein